MNNHMKKFRLVVGRGHGTIYKQPFHQHEITILSTPFYRNEKLPNFVSFY
jgi:hypothetical protein